MLVNTERARKSNRDYSFNCYILFVQVYSIGFVAIPIFRPFVIIIGMVPTHSVFPLSYLGFIWMMEVPYIRSETSQKNNKEEFKEAVYSNLFWENFE